MVKTVVNALPKFVLIETYWNVNNDFYDSTYAGVPGINRNILECKCAYVARYILKKHVLIETYWNVNLRGAYTNVLTDSY